MKKIDMAQMERIEGGKSIDGQGTMDCINDAYDNHGWVSVWLYIQTIAIPVTGLAIATNCMAKNVH
ncbi:hypothetical protein U0035_20760 [Niabella yanshanensis]|uniref:Bacteriocin n=1 Tax=Niabella yanshanensis TaxID=577386 RepID=A0ABZ0W4A6_9BACT|nr:hypothetical protein [Niabella yanshanensis]WQD38103.1 hypothetical protein U0035_20760 [Niabella yanshanensis]